LGSSSLRAVSCLHYRGRWYFGAVSIICGGGRLLDRVKSIGGKEVVSSRVMAESVTRRSECVLDVLSVWELNMVLGKLTVDR